MKIKELKRLIEGIDDEVVVELEVLTSENQIASGILTEVYDESVGFITFLAKEQGIA